MSAGGAFNISALFSYEPRFHLIKIFAFLFKLTIQILELFSEKIQGSLSNQDYLINKKKIGFSSPFIQKSFKIFCKEVLKAHFEFGLGSTETLSKFFQF